MRQEKLSSTLTQYSRWTLEHRHLKAIRANSMALEISKRRLKWNINHGSKSQTLSKNVSSINLFFFLFAKKDERIIFLNPTFLINQLKFEHD